MFEELQNEFGKLVRKRREELGLTQELTAELLEISVSNLRKIERGMGNANWEDWVKLSCLFSIDMDVLQRKHITRDMLDEFRFKDTREDNQQG